MEEGAEEAACLELVDLLLQGLPLPLGCGIAVVAEEDDDDERGEMDPEVAAEMLVEAPTVTAEDGTCSLITQGCELIPSEESAGGHGAELKRRSQSSELKLLVKQQDSGTTSSSLDDCQHLHTITKMLKVMRASLISLVSSSH